MTAVPEIALERGALPGLVAPQRPAARIIRPGVHEEPPTMGVNIREGSSDDGWKKPPPVILSDGTRVQLFKDGEGLHAAYEAIKAARRVIGLEVYIFADDATGRAFGELLCKKASEGVRVYIIYDAFGTRGLTGSEPAIFQRLRACGARVQVFHPTLPWECNYGWRAINRDHRKLLVIDGEIAGLGGLNIGQEYGGSWVANARAKAGEFWRDNAIGVTGPGARQFMLAFAHTWKYQTRGGRMRGAEFLNNVNEGDLGVMATVPTTKSPLLPFLYKVFREAERSILLTMAYFAPDDPLIDELCSAARRGVRVRLMLPGRCDVPVVRHCARSFYETLLTAGVEIFERQGVILHAKTLVVDEKISIVGSTNLDYRSIEYNCELSGIIRSEAFGGQMSELFENDVRFASQIKLSEWRRRPMWDRFVQWAVSRARYIL